jgi:hypothetical protein
MNLRSCIAGLGQICTERAISGIFLATSVPAPEAGQQLKHVKVHHDRQIRCTSDGHRRTLWRSHWLPGERCSKTKIFGNFVEVKAPRLRIEAKGNHLLYIGDHRVRAQMIAAASVIICDFPADPPSIACGHQVDKPERVVEVRARQRTEI